MTLSRKIFNAFHDEFKIAKKPPKKRPPFDKCAHAFLNGPLDEAAYAHYRDGTPCFSLLKHYQFLDTQNVDGILSTARDMLKLRNKLAALGYVENEGYDYTQYNRGGNKIELYRRLWSVRWEEILLTCPPNLYDHFLTSLPPHAELELDGVIMSREAAARKLSQPPRRRKMTNIERTLCMHKCVSTESIREEIRQIIRAMWPQRKV